MHSISLREWTEQLGEKAVVHIQRHMKQKVRNENWEEEHREKRVLMQEILMMCHVR